MTGIASSTIFSAVEDCKDTGDGFMRFTCIASQKLQSVL